MKTPTIWSGGAVTEIPYLYDSPTMTYDDSTVGYDYLNPQANQLNGLEPTLWGINYQDQVSYFYNSSDAYNDPDLEYNYLISGNQISQTVPTQWSET